MVTQVRGLWGLISQRLFFASAAGLSYRLWTCHWQHLPDSSNTEAHGFAFLVMHMRLHLSFILKYVKCTDSEMRRSLYKLMSFNRSTHVNNTPIKIYNISNPPKKVPLCPSAGSPHPSIGSRYSYIVTSVSIDEFFLSFNFV